MYLFSLNTRPKEYLNDANQKVVIGITLDMGIKPVDSLLTRPANMGQIRKPILYI